MELEVSLKEQLKTVLWQHSSRTRQYSYQLTNPASFANLKFTTFALGGTYNTTTVKSDAKSEKARRTMLDYLAVGLPFGKVGVGFGLIPYSSVGYKIESNTEDANTNNRRYNGSGGLNKAFLG
jgi:hypothetical protein